MKQAEFWPIIRRHFPRIEDATDCMEEGQGPAALEMFAIQAFINNTQGEDVNKIREFYKRFRDCDEYFED